MGEEKHFLIFEVGSFHFCAPVDTVLGIIMPPPVTTMPLTPFHVAGSFVFRGNVALAIDMRRQLGLPEFADGAGIFIVARLESGLVGFRADVVVDIVPASRLKSGPVAFPKLYRFFKHFVLVDEQIILQTDFEILFAAEAGAATLTGLLEIMGPLPTQQPEDSHEAQEGEQVGQGGGEAGDQEGAEGGSAEAEGQSAPQPEAEIELTAGGGNPPQFESELEVQESPAPRHPLNKPAPQPRPQVLTPPAGNTVAAVGMKPGQGAAQKPVRAGSHRQHQARQPVGHTRLTTGPATLRGQVPHSPAFPGHDQPEVPSRRFRGGVILGAAIILLLGLVVIIWWPAGEPPVSTKTALEKVGRESDGPSGAGQEHGRVVTAKPPAASKSQERRADLQASSKEAIVDQPRLALEERPIEVVRVETSDFTLTIERPAPQDKEQETTALLPVVEEETTVSLEMITHIVVKNDTLWDIAEKYLGNPIQYEELARLSRIQDPHWIYPGDIIRIVKRNNGDQ